MSKTLYSSRSRLFEVTILLKSPCLKRRNFIFLNHCIKDNCTQVLQRRRREQVQAHRSNWACLNKSTLKMQIYKGLEW